MKSWIVDLYESASGDSPVKAFIDDLPVKERYKVLTLIEVLENSGILLWMPHARSIQGHKNLFELRSQSGSNIQRIFYFHFTGQKFVLLHGFTKKTQKTPEREIETALKRKEDYLKRYKE